jgi:hypothetical protein
MMRRTRRITTGLTAILLLGAAACSNDPMSPDRAHSLRAPETARHDDVPPDQPCLSGWMSVDGRWVCDDPGI